MKREHVYMQRENVWLSHLHLLEKVMCVCERERERERRGWRDMRDTCDTCERYHTSDDVTHMKGHVCVCVCVCVCVIERERRGCRDMRDTCERCHTQMT